MESDGGKGLAEHAAAAREEDEAARSALVRITEEAETLKLLRETLAEAQAETARSITGPVATRAARHVGRILPGAEPAFADDLGLTAIRRAGWKRRASSCRRERRNSSRSSPGSRSPICCSKKAAPFR
ncbi:hypothetical protein ACFSHP_21695 [Novosphingobium panipatense]